MKILKGIKFLTFILSKQPFMLLLRTLCLITLVLLSAQLSAGDQHKLDSLNALIEADIADSTRSRLLFDLAEELGASDTLLAYSSL